MYSNEEIKNILEKLIEKLSQKDAQIEILKRECISPIQKKELDDILLESKNILEELD